jgi:hypothetical protein
VDVTEPKMFADPTTLHNGLANTANNAESIRIIKGKDVVVTNECGIIALEDSKQKKDATQGQPVNNEKSKRRLYNCNSCNTDVITGLKLTQLSKKVRKQVESSKSSNGTLKIESV